MTSGATPAAAAGLIRHLGVSGVRPAHLAQAQAIAPLVCVQNRYGIGAPPEAREFLRACGRQGVAFVPFFAIAGQGRERGTPDTEHDEVRTIAAAHGVTSAQVRLAWTLQQVRTCWLSSARATRITWRSPGGAAGPGPAAPIVAGVTGGFVTLNSRSGGLG